MRASETYALRSNSAAGANVSANVLSSDRYVLEHPPQSANARARNLTSF